MLTRLYASDRYTKIVAEYARIIGNAQHFSVAQSSSLFYRNEVRAKTFASVFSELHQHDLPSPNSVESHLIIRAKNNFFGGTGALSIVDGRCLGIYLKSSYQSDTGGDKARDSRALAILPPGTQLRDYGAKAGDFIAYFRGARVAYVLREIEGEEVEQKTEWMHWMRERFGNMGVSDEHIMRCEIVGECLVNEMSEWDVLEEPEKEGASCIFVLS